MNNEKRIFLFLILALGVFLLSQHFIPQAPVKEQPPVENNLTNQTEQNEAFSGKSLSANDLTEKKPLVEDVDVESFLLGEYVLHLAPQGGFVKSLELKKYPGEELVYTDFFFVPQFKQLEFKIEQSANALILRNKAKKITIVINSLPNNPYVLRVEIESPSLPIQEVQLFTQKEDQGTRFASRYQEIFYGQDELSRISWSGAKEKSASSPLSLLGARDKHFALALLSPPGGRYFFDRYTNGDNQGVVVLWEPEDDTVLLTTDIFIGPQKREILQRFGLERLIDYGFFHFFAVIIVKILFFFQSILHNWGLSIIALSTLIYIILFPLTAKSTKSMRKMQDQMKDIQPKVNEVRQKYKDKPQKMNKEIMELYRKNKVNPLGSLGGCLPMLLQIPIFVSLYQVLNRLVEIKGADFLWINDLSRPDYLFELPVSLPILGNGIHLLPLIMVGIMVLQQKYTTPQAQSSEQQKMMSILFPLIFGFIFYRFPSGLVLYWLCNSTFTFLYQLRLTRARPS